MTFPINVGGGTLTVLEVIRLESYKRLMVCLGPIFLGFENS